MTPEEKAVIEMAMQLEYAVGVDPISFDEELRNAVRALIYSCPQCNAGGHTCPGDGKAIGHTATDCGEHEDPHQDQVEAAMGAEDWIATTMTNALINDRIRLGTDEALVIRSNHGMWHVDTRDYWQPRAWDHIELRLELDVIPGKFLQYDPALPVEILCTPERLAVLRIQVGFPGSAVTSSDVD